MGECLGPTKLGKLQKIGFVWALVTIGAGKPLFSIKGCIHEKIIWNNASCLAFSASEPPWRWPMWISFFGITTAAAIALSVAAIMLQGVKGRESLR
jgi:hypothetical protein